MHKCAHDARSKLATIDRLGTAIRAGESVKFRVLQAQYCESLIANGTSIPNGNMCSVVRCDHSVLFAWLHVCVLCSGYPVMWMQHSFVLEAFLCAGMLYLLLLRVVSLLWSFFMSVQLSRGHLSLATRESAACFGQRGIHNCFEPVALMLLKINK